MENLQELEKMAKQLLERIIQMKVGEGVEVVNEKIYPIFKINELKEVWKFTDKDTSICMISDRTDDIGKVINKSFKGAAYDIDDKNYWSNITYNLGGFYQGQPIWYEFEEGMCPQIDFFDVENGMLFLDEYDSAKIYNIYPITLEQLKTMPFIWDIYKKLGE